MHTLVDFMTHVKGIEYILSILFIGGFLLLWEVLKPRPFATVAEATRDDLEHLKRTGSRETLKNIGKIATAPFVGLLYVIMLPIGFFFVLISKSVVMLVTAGAALLGRDISFEWRPMEAYLAGKKKKKTGDKAGGKQ